MGWNGISTKIRQGFPLGNHTRRLLCACVSNSNLVDARWSPSDFDPKSAVVYDNFVSEEEANLLAEQISALMRRRRYEKNHWDSVIVGYKEVELIDEDAMLNDLIIRNLLHRTRSYLQENHLTPASTFLPCHAIDLKADGELHAHVDSVRFSGGMVAGISLLSSAIMRLKPSPDGVSAQQQLGWDGGGYIPLVKCIMRLKPSPDGVSAQQQQQQQQQNQEDSARLHDGYVDLLLPPLSLYVLTGVSRYEYSHELLPSNSVFQDADANNTQVIRDQRYSLIFRDAKQ
eukprot:CAMPEP_0202474862 /NCGR_PEP_ID=MMETSP1360-20130828/92604_1 /ASSEMBLY_ACC=CAM_ASM_000848 /TAXON_ID=515479 /ORGANISM="Licmophora paradoxa, Strain CCMP2313" /LENGTH=285 /DNA_ID=CAMNT_0049102005 /DNA_START=1 /DNA_END=859 /DNA_ORIENTATION=-